MTKGVSFGKDVPPIYRKRLYQGIAAFAVVAAAAVFLIAKNAPHAAAAYEARIPHASAAVQAVYLTPQITESSPVTFGGGDAAAPAPGNGAYVTLIMSGLGLSGDLTERALADLPPETVLAFSPYGDLQKWIGAAKDGGREALVLLPMEPQSYPKDDPGPRALLTRVTDKENEDNLAAVLKAGAGAAGVMNFMGGEFLSSRKNLQPVFATLKKAGAVFVGGPGIPVNVPAETAAAEGLPFLAADIAIDTPATDMDVGKKLVELEALAKSRGYAVGVAAPYPVSFNMIKSWAADLDRRGVRLLPLSAMMKVKARHDQQQRPPALPEETPSGP